MNKTVNINLSGMFFHIDEDAYLKLQRYLEAIKRSFTDSQGRAEILADIEARIAELFTERLVNERQVVRLKEVDEVISIMGQPEDYLVDDEIFEDDPKTNTTGKSGASKKLFRDTDNSYIGGVSSGLAHYFGINVVWIRLIWLLLIFGFGTGLLLYIILWILVPEAKTTAEKLMMTGEPVNISNIEKKIKDGFDTVGDVAKNVSNSVSNAAKKVDTNKIKSGSKSFFNALANAVMFVFKLIAKFIGVVLIFIGASTIIALIIGLLSVGFANIVKIPGIDFVQLANSGDTPVWLAALFALFAVGIPFFFIFYLGLKILVNNLKSIGNIAKYSLLGLWIVSVIGLTVIGIRQASETAYNERFTEKHTLATKSRDTLSVKMLDNDIFKYPFYRHHNFKVATTQNGEKAIYRRDVILLLKPTTDSVAFIKIEKSADGNSYDKALTRAKNINYHYTVNDRELLLDTYLSTATENKFSDQELVLHLYLPVGSVVKFDTNTRDFLSRISSANIVTAKHVDKFLTVTENAVDCQSCHDDDIDVTTKAPKVKINTEEININTNNKTLIINDKGINAQSDEVTVKIDSNGINIETKKD